MKRGGIAVELHSLAGRIVELKKQAVKLGVFTEDRDLLSCKRCGLFEDVLAGSGFLVVKRPCGKKDCGLRFQPAGRSKKRFRCPSCGALV